jgi:hypothetical protein
VLEVVVLRSCGVVDVEGLFGDERGDVLVALAIFAGLLGGLFGRHDEVVLGGCGCVWILYL